MTLLPPGFLDNVIAIGEKTADGKTAWIASGFLYAYKIPETDDKYSIFVVTCKHVFQNKKSIVIRLNKDNKEDSQEFEIGLLDQNGNNIWLAHHDLKIDCAILLLNAQTLKEYGISISAFRSDQNSANRNKMCDLGIVEGDSIFVLGFPLGIVDPKRNLAIVRGGIISRVRDMYSRNSNNFIIDASIFPGNSGGPVVTKPEVFSVKSTKSVNQSFLIGIISSYIPYQDIAFSQQTKRPLLVLQENSGLAKVIPIDYVEEIIIQVSSNNQKSQTANT